MRPHTVHCTLSKKSGLRVSQLQLNCFKALSFHAEVLKKIADAA